MSVPTIGDEIALWSEYHGVKFDAEAYEALKHGLRRVPEMKLRAELDEARTALDAATRRSYYSCGAVAVLFVLVLHLLEQVLRLSAMALD